MVLLKFEFQKFPVAVIQYDRFMPVYNKKYQI